MVAVAGPTWAADSALLDTRDGAHATKAYLVASGAGLYDLHTLPTALYDPTAGPNSDSNYLAWGNAAGSAYPAPWQIANGDTGIGVFYAADDTLTITVVTTIAAPPVVPTGVLRVSVLYFEPVTAVAANFA